MQRLRKENINTSEYWENFSGQTYKNNVRKTGIARYIEVIKYIRYSSSILEVGCNFGDFLIYMIENSVDFNTYSGFDFSKIAISDAKINFPEHDWIEGDCHCLEVKENEYDIIVSMQTLEHIENPIVFLKRAYSILKENGEIIITVPNETRTTHKSHVWSFNKEDLIALLNDSGFKDIDIKEIDNSRYLLATAKKIKKEYRKISVVTCVLCPSKNVFTTIEKCFESIRKAVDKVDGEWIIVDDGSLVGQEFFERIADVYLKNEKTVGVSYSLNRGMKIGKGELLVKQDSDYLVPEDMFEILLNDWSDDLCFIAPSFCFGRPNDQKELDIKNLPTPESGIEYKPRGENKYYKYGWGGGIMMFSAKAMKDVEYFDENFGIGGGQDNDIIYRMLMKGYNWCWTRNTLARHFASVSSTDPNAPNSRGERRKVGIVYFKNKHGFEPGGFISKVYSHFNYDTTHFNEKK